jgi:fluoride exporter
MQSALQCLSDTIGKITAQVSTLDPNLRAPIAVSLGAVPGALSRYYLSRWIVLWFGDSFPYGTLLINLTGALAMGFFVTFTVNRSIASPDLWLLVAVGFLGSYTTFSTYALDTVRLLQTGNWERSLFYGLGSVVLGVACIKIGSFLATQLSR